MGETGEKDSSAVKGASKTSTAQITVIHDDGTGETQFITKGDGFALSIVDAIMRGVNSAAGEYFIGMQEVNEQ